MAARDQIPEGKIVPPRNDPKALEPYARSKALELQGRDPEFEYQWFRPDQLSEKLSRHEIGNQFTGFLMVDPWEVVDTTQGVTQVRTRDDAGRGVDTTMTNGDLVLCRTPRANHAKYAVIEQRMDEKIDQRLAGGQAHNFGYGTTFKTRTVGGDPERHSVATKVLEGI